MDLGVLASDVVTYAETTFGSFGVLIALAIGIALAAAVIRKFLKVR